MQSAVCQVASCSPCVELTLHTFTTRRQAAMAEFDTEGNIIVMISANDNEIVAFLCDDFIQSECN